MIEKLKLYSTFMVATFPNFLVSTQCDNRIRWQPNARMQYGHGIHNFALRFCRSTLQVRQRNMLTAAAYKWHKFCPTREINYAKVVPT